MIHIRQASVAAIIGSSKNCGATGPLSPARTRSPRQINLGVSMIPLRLSRAREFSLSFFVWLFCSVSYLLPRTCTLSLAHFRSDFLFLTQYLSRLLRNFVSLALSVSLTISFFLSCSRSRSLSLSLVHSSRARVYSLLLSRCLSCDALFLILFLFLSSFSFSRVRTLVRSPVL